MSKNKSILSEADGIVNNRDEEKEHAAMVLERVGRKDDYLDK